MHINIPSWLVEWLKGAGCLWLLSTIIHYMPEPTNPTATTGQKLYLWLYNVIHAIGANWSKLQFNLPSPTKLAGILLALAALALCSGQAHAQEQSMFPNNSVFIGVAGNSQNSPPFLLSGAFRKYVSGAAGEPGSLYSLTFYDVSGIQLSPFAITHAQYSGKQGLWLILYKPARWLRLGMLADGGITGTSGVATGSTFGGGGGADFDLGKNLHVFTILPVSKNTVSGVAFEPRAYVGVAW